MSWSKVKEDALVASGRHCCICHKFCGIKIEAHHIVLQSEGGQDTSDNCIMLCFDCHADMKSYDHNHPKGTKYTHSELKRHRDNWYEKVKNNLGTGNIVYLNQDISTFNFIFNKLTPVGSIQFLRQFNFDGYSFHDNKTWQLESFVEHLKNEPWREFFDSDLESLRTGLVSHIENFNNLISEYSNPLRTNSNMQQIVIQDVDKYNWVISQIHDTTVRIVKTYDELIKLSRKKLGVDPNSGG
jgi:hypothetical protein